MTQNIRVSFRRALAGYHVGDVRRLLSALELRAAESESEIAGLRAQLAEATVAVDSLSAELALRRVECVTLRDEAERARVALRVLRIERNSLAERSEPTDLADDARRTAPAPSAHLLVHVAAAIEA